MLLSIYEIIVFSLVFLCLAQVAVGAVKVITFGAALTGAGAILKGGGDGILTIAPDSTLIYPFCIHFMCVLCKSGSVVIKKKCGKLNKKWIKNVKNVKNVIKNNCPFFIHQQI